jgi:bacterioferritin-associated ferredoxin
VISVVLCICRSVTDREVDDAIHRGACSLDDVASACGAGTDCGMCQNAIEDRITGASPCGGGCADCPRKAAAIACASH